MAAPDVLPAGLQDIFLPVVLQSILSEICCRAVVALVQSSYFLEGGSSNSTITCIHLPAETRPSDINATVVEDCTMVVEDCTASSQDSNIDEEEADSSEKCRMNILSGVAVPKLGDKVPRQLFSKWLLVARNKDEEGENDDEDDEDDEDEDDEGGDEEEGDDDEGGDAKGEKEDGDEDEEEDEDDDDDDEDEDEEEEDDDEEDDDEDDESPPKKLRK